MTALSCAASGPASSRCTAWISGDVCEAASAWNAASMRDSRRPLRSNAATVLSKSGAAACAAMASTSARCALHRRSRRPARSRAARIWSNGGKAKGVVQSARRGLVAVMAWCDGHLRRDVRFRVARCPAGVERGRSNASRSAVRTLSGRIRLSPTSPFAKRRLGRRAAGASPVTRPRTQGFTYECCARDHNAARPGDSRPEPRGPASGDVPDVAGGSPPREDNAPMPDRFTRPRRHLLTTPLR